jgi:hypothetical protein
LHVWLHGFGMHLWTGLSLNLVFFLFTAFALFRFGLYVFNDIFEASFLTFLWALSPATIVTSLMARNWDLLTLVTVLFAWQTTRYVENDGKPGKLDLLFLALVTCLGVLSHYQFLVIVLPAGILLAVLRLARRNIRNLLLFIVPILIGCASAYCLHPDFSNSFLVSQKMARDPFDVRDLPYRMMVVLAAYGSFFTALLQRISDWGLLFDPTHSPPLTAPSILEALSYGDLTVMAIVGLISLAMGCCIAFTWRVSKHVGTLQALWNSPQGGSLWFGLFLAGSVTAEYLAFVLDRTAFRERYLSMIWPFFALILVFAVRHTGKKALFSSILIGLSLFQGVNQMIHFHSMNTGMGNPDSLMKNAESLVIDTFNEGKLFPILWHVPDDKMVFVAPPHYLLKNGEKWLDGLRGNSLIISVLGYSASPEDQKRIVGLASTRCAVSLLDVPIWRWTVLFQTKSCHQGNRGEGTSQ